MEGDTDKGVNIGNPYYRLPIFVSYVYPQSMVRAVLFSGVDKVDHIEEVEQ